MSPIKEQLLNVVDLIPESRQALLLEIAKCFITDDAATSSDLEDIAAARAEYVNGETVGHESVNWD